MALKFSDALRLSWGNITQYKRRSVIISLTISLLFGVIFGFSFMLDGLSKTIFDATMQASDGKIYIATGYLEITSLDQSNFSEVEDLESAEKLIAENAERYHGQVVGQITQYNIGNTRWVVNQELAKRFSDLDYNKSKDIQIPYVGPKIEDESFDSYLKDANGDADELLIKVGTYPATEPGNPTLPGFNLLNLLLSGVHGSYTHPLIVDDGSGKVMQYLQNQASQSSHSQDVTPYLQQTVIMFNNYDDAIAYYWDVWDVANGEGTPRNIKTSDGKKYTIHSGEVFSNVIDAKLNIRNLQNTLIMIEIIFIVVAIIVATLTFAHLIDQDAATIALYRSMGANTSSIYLIYLLYLLELCALAILSCILIALTLVGIMWLWNHAALASRLESYYYLDNPPKVRLFGINKIILWVVGSIIIIAPISLLLTLRRFSAKHITKQLKED